MSVPPQLDAGYLGSSLADASSRAFDEFSTYTQHVPRTVEDASYPATQLDRLFGAPVRDARPPPTRDTTLDDARESWVTGRLVAVARRLELRTAEAQDLFLVATTRALALVLDHPAGARAARSSTPADEARGAQPGPQFLLFSAPTWSVELDGGGSLVARPIPYVSPSGRSTLSYVPTVHRVLNGSGAAEILAGVTLERTGDLGPDDVADFADVLSCARRDGLRVQGTLHWAPVPDRAYPLRPPGNGDDDGDDAATSDDSDGRGAPALHGAGGRRRRASARDITVPTFGTNHPALPPSSLSTLLRDADGNSALHHDDVYQAELDRRDASSRDSSAGAPQQTAAIRDLWGRLSRAMQNWTTETLSGELRALPSFPAGLREQLGSRLTVESLDELRSGTAASGYELDQVHSDLVRDLRDLNDNMYGQLLQTAANVEARAARARLPQFALGRARPSRDREIDVSSPSEGEY